MAMATLGVPQTRLEKGQNALSLSLSLSLRHARRRNLKQMEIYFYSIYFSCKVLGCRIRFVDCNREYRWKYFGSERKPAIDWVAQPTSIAADSNRTRPDWKFWDKLEREEEKRLSAVEEGRRARAAAERNAETAIGTFPGSEFCKYVSSFHT